MSNHSVSVVELTKKVDVWKIRINDIETFKSGFITQKLCDAVGEEISVPRINKTHFQRCNLQTINPEEYVCISNILIFL